MAGPPSARDVATTLRRSGPVHAALSIAFATMAALGALNLRLRALAHRSLTQRAEDAATLPSPRAVRALALGHREWAADMLYASALVYFGSAVAERLPQRYLQRYIDTIEQVDPRFRQAYLWGATVSMYNTRIIRRESVDATIAHLERGLRAFPNDPEMLYQLGFDYFFELPHLLPSPEERAVAKRRGAELLRRAAARGYGPPWMALAAAGALQDAGLIDRAIEDLRALYVRADAPEVRARIEARIDALLGERASADPFLVEVRRLEAERSAAYPYVPPALYLFVGPPVLGIARAGASTNSVRP